MDTFGLFSVTPIGIALILSGIAYWASDYFERIYGIHGELFEARVTVDSPMAGMSIHQVESTYEN